MLRQYFSPTPERYLTTQHERDTETGYDNRGARLYDADLMRFLSVDPLAADYAAWSAFNYVLGNPLRVVDSDGKAPDDIIITIRYNHGSEVLTQVRYMPDGSLRTVDNKVYTGNDQFINEVARDLDIIRGMGGEFEQDLVSLASSKMTHEFSNYDYEKTPRMVNTHNMYEAMEQMARLHYLIQQQIKHDFPISSFLMIFSRMNCFMLRIDKKVPYVQAPHGSW